MQEMANFHSSSDSSYASVPSSARRKFSSSFNNNPAHFYSEPTSPTCRTSSASDFPFLWELEKEQLTKTSPSGDNSDENFEFKTSTTNFDTPLNFLQHQPGLLNHKTEQAISFADQLFHNGQILPLKPPPRYQFRDGSNTKSVSEKSVLKSSFTCWSFNKSDFEFDPFMAALEHVKKEERRKNYQGNPLESRRRSRSLSPMRSTSPLHWTNSNDHSSSWNIKNRSKEQHKNSTPTQPTDPKISAFAKPVEGPSNKPTTTLVVFPGTRSVQVVSVQKKCKRVNIVKEFLLLRMECLGGKGRF